MQKLLKLFIRLTGQSVILHTGFGKKAIVVRFKESIKTIQWKIHLLRAHRTVSRLSESVKGRLAVGPLNLCLRLFATGTPTEQLIPLLFVPIFSYRQFFRIRFSRICLYYRPKHYIYFVMAHITLRFRLKLLIFSLMCQHLDTFVWACVIALFVGSFSYILRSTKTSFFTIFLYRISLQSISAKERMKI